MFCTVPVPLQYTVSEPPQADVYEHFPGAEHVSPTLGSADGQAPLHDSDRAIAQYDCAALHSQTWLPHGPVNVQAIGPVHGSFTCGAASGHVAAPAATQVPPPQSCVQIRPRPGLQEQSDGTHPDVGSQICPAPHAEPSSAAHPGGGKTHALASRTLASRTDVEVLDVDDDAVVGVDVVDDRGVPYAARVLEDVEVGVLADAEIGVRDALVIDPSGPESESISYEPAFTWPLQPVAAAMSARYDNRDFMALLPPPARAGNVIRVSGRMTHGL
ncbi:MAG: hypothetical protein FWD17_13030 [Polyangiaceae bacterium]|nr:hypothetical protein [Polyangiaceae bacterium]